MSIYEMEGYFENSYDQFLGEPMLFLLVLNLIQDKAFSFSKIKTNPNYSVKVFEKSNCTFSICFMNHLVQLSMLF